MIHSCSLNFGCGTAWSVLPCKRLWTSGRIILSNSERNVISSMYFGQKSWFCRILPITIFMILLSYATRNISSGSICTQLHLASQSANLSKAGPYPLISYFATIKPPVRKQVAIVDSFVVVNQGILYTQNNSRDPVVWRLLPFKVKAMFAWDKISYITIYSLCQWLQPHGELTKIKISPSIRSLGYRFIYRNTRIQLVF